MESTMMVGDHLYVSKVAYGPRVPITPIAFPFAQNRMLGVESYSKLIQLDYKRLKGFNQVERDDIVVFNFPAGDTVAVRYSAQSYYSLIRQLAYPAYKRDLSTGMTQSYEAYKNAARKKIKAENEMVFRPIDRRDNYIKRCVAVPGDSLEIIRGQIYVNGKAQPAYKGIQHRYIVITNGNPLNPRALEEYDIPKSWLGIQNNPRYTMYLSDEMAQTLLKDIKEIVKVEKYINEGYDWLTFPYSEQYQWNIDNYGPIYIPKAGVSVRIDSSSLPFYERIIQAYEGNDLKVEGNDIYINGELSDTYTFKMDYYWMMGDNRHQSSDARIWGYVPENHIVGKPKFIWLSLNEHKSFPGNIRLRRMFNKIDPGE